MKQFILDLDFLTTKEFCEKYDIAPPKISNKMSKEELAFEFIMLDAIKYKMIVENAKKSQKKISSKYNDVEFIICSAVKYKGYPICGRRHSDCYKIIEKLTNRKLEDIKEFLPNSNLDNGFMTSTGRYITRSEAWDIAEQNNQISIGYEASKSEDGSILISENLY